MFDSRLIATVAMNDLDCLLFCLSISNLPKKRDKTFDESRPHEQDSTTLGHCGNGEHHEDFLEKSS